MIKKYITFFLLTSLYFIIADSPVKANTYNMNYEYYQQYYDNSGSSVTSVNTTWNESLQSYVSANIPTVANSYGAGLSISSPIPLLANHTYSMSIYFDGLSNISLSSKNNIAIGNSLGNASSNYVNGNYLTTMNYSSVSNNTILKFAFTTSSNGSFIFIPWTTTSTLSQSYVLTQMSIDDLGSGGVSQSDINNSLNNQTNIIQNHINDVENNINNNINNVLGNKCDNLFDYNLQPSVNALGNFTFTNNKGVFTFNGTDGSYKYIGYNLTLDAGTYNFGSISSGGSLDGYSSIIDDNSGNSYTCYGGNCQFTLSSRSTITFYIFRVGANTLTFNNFVVKPYISKTSTSWCEYGSYSSKLDDTNEQLGDLNDNITNSNTTDATNEAGGFFNDFTTDTHGLTAIITTPLSLISSITSASCSPLVLPLPYVDKDLTLPCMSTIYSDYFGDFLTIYQTITFGIVAYWVCVRIFNLVKDFKNPDHDEIEVLDL